MSSWKPSPSSQLSIIVPAFDESRVIARTLDQLSAMLKTLDLEYEIVVVDDGSGDDTAAVVSAAADQDTHIRLVSYSPNRGKGNALRTGFQICHGETVVFYDADLDIPVDCIPELLIFYNSDDFDGIVGSKLHPKSIVDYPIKRRILSNAVHAFIWALFRIPVADTQVGLKIFRREVLEAIVDRSTANGFAFDIELLALAQASGYRIGEGPIRIAYGQSRLSTSTVNWRSVGRTLVDTLRVFYRIKLRGHRERR
jgi:dolichol-phosphate mannosyltransferase